MAIRRFPVSPLDFLDISSGRSSKLSVIHKFGMNPDIDLGGGFEAIWNGGGPYTGFDATAAEVVEVFSSAAADASAGTGARTAKVFGLDGNYVQQSETVTLNGVTPVNTVNSYLRLDTIQVITAGSGGSNAGTITVRQSITTANVFAVMPIGNNRTMIAAFTVPAGNRAYLTNWFTAWSSKKQGFSTVQFKSRPFNQVFEVREEAALVSDGTSYLLREYFIPKSDFDEKTDIVIQADSSAPDVAISAGFDLILEKIPS
jgi:hypothetical protein